MPWTRLSQANAIEQLQTAVERTVFDLKRTYDLAAAQTVFEIAKDIVAFANNVGGTILVGAVEGVDTLWNIAVDGITSRMDLAARKFIGFLPTGAM